MTVIMETEQGKNTFREKIYSCQKMRVHY